MASSKVCFKCKQRKALSDFYRHPNMGDGHLNKCKECTKCDVSAHRSANIARVRAYDRNRAKVAERTRKAAATSKKWRLEDSRRARCHSAVARALRSGKLEHKSCEWPGCSNDNSVAHHEDYDRPLDVIFYCQPHHKARHAQIRKEREKRQ